MGRKIKTGIFRVSYADVHKSRTYEDNPPKYGVTMLFKKNDKEGMASLKKLAQETLKEQWPDEVKRKKLMKNPKFKNPFRDGDLEKPDTDGYAGTTFIRASMLDKGNGGPQVIDRKTGALLTTDDEFYSGCMAKATVTCYAFDKKVNKGIAFGLQNLLKIDDGDRFDGRSNAVDDFSDEEGFGEDLGDEVDITEETEANIEEGNDFGDSDDSEDWED